MKESEMLKDTVKDQIKENEKYLAQIEKQQGEKSKVK